MRSKRAFGVILSLVVFAQVFLPLKAMVANKPFWVEQLWRINGAKVSVLKVTLDGFFILKKNSSGTSFDYLDNKNGKSLWDSDSQINKVQEKYIYWGISEGHAIIGLPGKLDFYDVTTGKKSYSMDGLPEISSLYSYGDYIFAISADKSKPDDKPKVLRIDAVSLKVISTGEYPEKPSVSGSLKIVGFVDEDALIYSTKFQLIRFNPEKSKIVWKITSKQGVYPRVDLVCGKIVTMKYVPTTCGEVGKAVCVLDPKNGKEIWNHTYEGQYTFAFDKIFLWNDNYCDIPSEKFFIISIETGAIRKILDCGLENPKIASNDDNYCIVGSVSDKQAYNYMRFCTNSSLDKEYWSNYTSFDWPETDNSNYSLDLTFNGYLLIFTGEGTVDDSNGFICTKLHGENEKSDFVKTSAWKLDNCEFLTGYGDRCLVAEKDSLGIVTKLDLLDIESGKSLWDNDENSMIQHFVGNKMEDLKFRANGRYVVYWERSGELIAFDIATGTSTFIGSDLGDFENDGVFDKNRFAARDKDGNLAVFDLNKAGFEKKIKLPLQNPWQLVAMKGNLVFVYDMSVMSFDLSAEKFTWKSTHKDKEYAEIDKNNSFANETNVICSKRYRKEDDYSYWSAMQLDGRLWENAGGAFQDNIACTSYWVAGCVVGESGGLFFSMTELTYSSTYQTGNSLSKKSVEISSISLSRWNNYILVAVNGTDGHSTMYVVDCYGRLIGSVDFEKAVTKIKTFWNKILVSYPDGSLESILLSPKD